MITTKYVLAISSIFVFLFFSVENPAQIKTHIQLLTGEQAIEYLPKNFTPTKEYGLLIALHGMGQTMESAFQAWKGVADQHQLILICPKGSNFAQGYTRKKPKDDRIGFIKLKNNLLKKYLIPKNKVILAGFSRGGNFAIESGLKYPQHFPNIVCVFGFFNQGTERLIHAQSHYKNSKFYLITGQNDSTQPSLKRAHSILKNRNIPVQLFTYSNIHHQYPPDIHYRADQMLGWFF